MKNENTKGLTLRKKCPYSELYWSAFSRSMTEYGEILRISPHSVQMWENADKNNSKYGPFLRNVKHIRLKSSQEFTFFF